MPRTGVLRRRPPVDLAHSDAVYDYYLTYRAQRWRATTICRLLNRRYRPRVNYEQSTSDALQEAYSRNVPLVIAMNHLTTRDPFTIAAAAWAGPLRPVVGRAQSLGKDQLFSTRANRWLIESMGGIPVFRGKDHGMRATNAAAQRLIDVCATRLANGDNLVVFPEGTCNLTDPATVQSVGSGVGHIIFRAGKQGVKPIVIPVGLSYGPEASKRGASLWIGDPIVDLPNRPIEIARLIRTKLQDAVDLAVKHY